MLPRARDAHNYNGNIRNCLKREKGMHRMVHPLGVIVTGRYYLTKTLSSMKFFPFGIRNKPVLKLACSILHSLNQNFTAVYNVDTTLE